ncbi:MAG TPA: GNAT family N-acetyltransferase, partial [Gammaproteobacteria bacterium]|nr:GNAT family N-acetyltransferase [Gammaproteobacteria bacterium]
LVGFVLAFLMRSRREMAEFFDAPIPDALDADGRTIYIADWAIDPAHRGAFKFMAARLAEVFASDEELRALPVNAFATPEYAQKWRTQARWLLRSGYRFVANYPYHDARLDRPMFWMHFEPDRPPAGAEPVAPRDAPLTCRVVKDLRGWADLRRVWDRLLAASPDRTPWQSYAFLTLWWRYLSGDRALRIFIVERGGVPCLALPMQLTRWKCLPGLPVRLLEPIGMVMDVNRPRLALGAFDEAAYRCAFDAIWGLRDDWHVVRVDEKPWDDREMALLRDYGVERGCVFRQVFSHLVPYLDLRQSWQTYLRSRSPKLRKNLKASRRKLEQRGAVTLERHDSEEGVVGALQTVLDLHARSWKKRKRVEHSRAEGYSEFFGDWVHHMASLGRCRVLVLRCGAKPVAATVAFLDGDTYYSAQIVHDAEFAACSPGTLLEAMEIEALMNEGRFARYEMMGSFISNKMRWTDTATVSSHVLLLRRRVRTFAMDAFYFFIKPYLRPLVVTLKQRLKLAGAA